MVIESDGVCCYVFLHACPQYFVLFNKKISRLDGHTVFPCSISIPLVFIQWRTLPCSDWRGWSMGLASCSVKSHHPVVGILIQNTDQTDFIGNTKTYIFYIPAHLPLQIVRCLPRVQCWRKTFLLPDLKELSMISK